MSTKETVKTAAVGLARHVGLINLTRRSVCEAAGLSDGSWEHVMGVSFGDFVAELRREGVGVGDVVTRQRVSPELRKHQILAAALTVIEARGYHELSRRAVAEQAGVSEGLVSHYFNTKNQLRRAVMREAVHSGRLSVLAQGLAHKDPEALKAPDHLRSEALATLA